jgi:hypothetical protein
VALDVWSKRHWRADWSPRDIGAAILPAAPARCQRMVTE